MWIYEVYCGLKLLEEGADRRTCNVDPVTGKVREAPAPVLTRRAPQQIECFQCAPAVDIFPDRGTIREVAAGQQHEDVPIPDRVVHRDRRLGDEHAQGPSDEVACLNS